MDKIRVYGIVKNDFYENLMVLSNDEFMTIAEEQGNVFTLNHFQEEFNINEIPENMYIRFINVK